MSRPHPDGTRFLVHIDDGSLGGERAIVVVKWVRLLCIDVPVFYEEAPEGGPDFGKHPVNPDRILGIYVANDQDPIA